MKTEEELNEQMATEDQSNVKSEKISEIEAKLAEDDPDDITVEESIQTLSKEEVEAKVKTIDDEHRKYLLERAKEADIDWDKIEFIDETKDIPVLSDKDRSLFITVSEDYFGRELLDMYINEANETITQYKEMRALVESGNADKADVEYFETLSKGYQEARIVLASIQKSAREIEASFKDSKITEDFVKSVTLNTLHEFIVKKFRFNHSFLNSEDDDLREKIDEDIKKHMFVVTMFDYYLDRYESKFRGDIDRKIVNGGKNNIFSPIFNEFMLNNYINSVNTYIKNLEEKVNIDVSKIINTDLKAMEFSKACVVYATVKENASFKVALKDKDYEVMDSKLNFDGINNENIKSIIDEINKFVAYIKQEDKFNKLISSVEYQLKHHPCFKVLDDLVGDKEENLCDYAACIKVISERFPVVEGTNLTREWKDWYSFMKIYETYYSIVSLKNKETKEDIDYYNVFSLLFSDFNMYLYSDFVTDIDQFVTESVYKKDTRSFMFGMLMNNLLLQHELGFKADIRTKEESVEDLDVPKDENGCPAMKELPINNVAPGIYSLAKEVFRDQYDYMVGEESTDILLKDVDLIETRKKYMEVTARMLKFMNSCINELVNVESFDKPVVVQPKKNKKKNHKRR